MIKCATPHMIYSMCLCVTHQVEVGDRHDGLQLLALPAIHEALQDEGDALGNVLIEQPNELRPVGLRQRVHPTLPVGLEAQVLGVYIDHTTARDSRWTGILQVSNLVIRVRKGVSQL